MRWKISHHGHDSRQIDLLAVVAIFVLTVAAFSVLERAVGPPIISAAWVEPSQSVRW